MKLTISFLCFVLFASTVYAVHYIYSNNVLIPAVPQYALSLVIDTSKPYYINETIHCTGALTLDGEAVNDALIYVFQNGTKVGEGSTNSLGIFDIPFTRTQSGLLNVTARYEAP